MYLLVNRIRTIIVSILITMFIVAIPAALPPMNAKADQRMSNMNSVSLITVWPKGQPPRNVIMFRRYPDGRADVVRMERVGLRSRAYVLEEFKEYDSFVMNHVFEKYRGTDRAVADLSNGVWYSQVVLED